MLLIDKIINMNNIINKFLLAGDKFMPKMYLRQPQFVYSACGPFTRHKERIKKFKQTGDTRYIYRNEFDKACFQHDSAYAAHKVLINRTEADKVLRDKAYDIASNPEYDGYQRGLASMVYKFFDKKSMGSGIKKDSSLILADELHQPVIKKFNKRKVYSQFKDNIWGVDLADMQSLSKKNKNIKCLLCAIDLYSKYAFVVPLKDKKGINVTNGFNKIIKQSGRKPNKIWVNQGSEFYSHVFKRWLSRNNTIMYSTTYNEGKSLVAERFIRTLKNKLYKHMTATGKNVYYDVLDDIVYEYNNTKHNTIKVKPKDVENKSKRVYIDEHNEKRSRFKIGDRVRISKFKNILSKGYTLNWSREIFIVNKINDTVPYTYNIKDLNDEEIIGSFYDRELQKVLVKVLVTILK